MSNGISFWGYSNLGSSTVVMNMPITVGGVPHADAVSGGRDRHLRSLAEFVAAVIGYIFGNQRAASRPADPPGSLS